MHEEYSQSHNRKEYMPAQGGIELTDGPLARTTAQAVKHSSKNKKDCTYDAIPKSSRAERSKIFCRYAIPGIKCATQADNYEGYSQAKRSRAAAMKKQPGIALFTMLGCLRVCS